MHIQTLNPSKYKRLFTFGCSFTRYLWPTWADILAEDIPYYENWGCGGAGNLYISNAIMEAHNRHTLTKDYLNELSSVTGIPVSELFNPIIGGKYPGTWVHRKVGYHLAQWISPKFAVQVSLILDELFISGKVELKHSDEIDNEYKSQITTLKTKLDTNTDQYKKLLIKHNSSLKTHRYIKFKKTDPCFYIIDSGVDCDCLCYKFGITGLDQGNNIDDRL
jgi:hypothetical protein